MQNYRRLRQRLLGAHKFEGDADLEEIIRAEQQLRDRQAPNYDELNAWMEWQFRSLTAFYRKYLKLSAYHVVLDAGCGTGRDLPWLCMTARRVIGVDHSPNSLEIAQARVPDSERVRLDLMTADLRRLPLADASVDRLLCSQVLQHIPGDDNRRAVAQEFYRVLRPGGVAVIGNWRWRGAIRRCKEGFFRDTPLYRYAFTVHEYRELWVQAGFSEVRVGGAVLLPKLSEALNIKPQVQLPLAFTPIGRKLGYWVVACMGKHSSSAAGRGGLA